MLTRILTVVALASTLTGCSLAFVNGPPGYLPPDEPVPIESCTLDRTFPLLDAIGAGSFLVTTLTSSDGTEVRISALVGGALGISSFVGFRRVRTCKERVLRAIEESSALDIVPQATTWNAGPLLTAPRPIGATALGVPRHAGGGSGD